MKLLILAVLLISFSYSQSTQCRKYVEKLIQDIAKFNLTQLPLPSIMYSGITTNNPGQMEECQNANYNYYLVDIKNYQTSSYTFTGLCVPDQCTAQDIEIIASQYLHCKVYQYQHPTQYDYLTYMGAVIISLWIVVLTVWSCFISLKEPVVNQYMSNEGDRNSINAEPSEPLLQTENEQKEDYKIFNYYEGYLRIFKVPSKKSIFSPIFALAVLSYAISIQFSYRQTIAQNQDNSAPDLLNSASGVFVCNTQIALHTIIFILGIRVAYGTYKIKSFRGIGRYFFDQILKKWLLLILMTLLIYSFMTLFTNQPLSKVWSLKYGQDCPNYMWQIWFIFRNLQLDCKLCLPWISLIETQLLFTLISAPLLMIFKFKKQLGYGLFVLLNLTSIFISFAILDSKQVTYEPTKLMNGDPEFVIDYQGNSFVRMGAFFTGLMLGLVIIEGLQKNSQGKSKQYQLAKKLKRNNGIQMILHLVGLAIMITTYLLIIPYLGDSNNDEGTYVYLILAPLFFIYGLGVFILPNFFEGESKLTVLINRVLGWRTWVHFDKIAIMYFILSPMVIGFTNYSMQSSIYYDYLTVVTYMLGDLFIAYIISLVCTAAFECQLEAIVSWMQVKIFGNELKYSVLVIEQ